MARKRTSGDAFRLSCAGVGCHSFSFDREQQKSSGTSKHHFERRSRGTTKARLISALFLKRTDLGHQNPNFPPYRHGFLALGDDFSRPSHLPPVRPPHLPLELGARRNRQADGRRLDCRRPAAARRRCPTGRTVCRFPEKRTGFRAKGLGRVAVPALQFLHWAAVALLTKTQRKQGGRSEEDSQ